MAQMLMQYVRRKNKDTWHCHKDCSKRNALKGKLVTTPWRNTRPSSGELCNECLAKDAA